MPVAWYWWLALLAALFLAAGLATAAASRRTARGRRFWALSTRGKLAFGRALLRDRHTPLPARLTLLLLVGYLLLPFDLIPDFIPVLGQVDDLLVLALVVSVLLAILPRDRLDEALSAGEQASGRR